MADNDLTITIGAKTEGAEAGFDKLGKKTEELHGTLGQLAVAAGELFAAFEVIAKPIEAFGREEKASNQLAQSLKTQGIYSSELAESYEKQAEALSKKSTFTQAEIVQGQALLQNLIGQKEITPELTKAVADFAAANRMGLAEAFEMVGRSAFGSTMMLKRHGVVVEENLSANERLAKFMQQVSQKFDGQAEAANRGVSGLAQVSKAFEKLEAAIGARLAPTVEKIAANLAALFDTLSHSEGFITLAEVALEAVAAFTAFAGAMKLGSVAAGVMRVAAEGLWGATGIGLIVVVITEVALHWNTIWPAMQGVFHAFVNNIGSAAAALGKIILGAFSFDPTLVKQGISELADTLKKGWSDITTTYKAGTTEVTKSVEGMTEAQRKAGAANAAMMADLQSRQIAAERAKRAALIAEANKESKEMIAIKKQEAATLEKIADDKNKAIRKQLEAHYKDLQMLEARQADIDAQRQKAFQTKYLANEKAFQKMTADQQKAYLLQHGQAMQESIDTADTAQAKYLDTRLKMQIEADNQFLQDEQQFGRAYAEIHRVMHSEIYQGAKKAFGELAELQTSSNSTLKAIGKVAAIANIVIKTAESAMNIYEGFSTIPIIGPALGIAGAAAAVAFGAEQVGKVNSANQGGIVPGFGPDRDSTLSFLTPGELVVPRSNFDETVNAVADSRNSQRSGGGSGDGAAMLSEIRDQLKAINSKFDAPVTIKGDVMADTTYVDALVRKITDAVRYRNANLVAAKVGV